MQVGISVLFIVGTRPGELWVLDKYLLKEGREGWRGCLGYDYVTYTCVQLCNQ